MEEAKTEIDKMMKEDIEIGTELLRAGNISDFCREEANVKRVIKFITAAKSVKEYEESWEFTQAFLDVVNSLTKITIAAGAVLSVVELMWLPVPSSPFWCEVELAAMLVVAFASFILAPLLSKLAQSFLTSVEPKVELYRELSKKSQKVVDSFGGFDAMNNTIVTSCPGIAEKAEEYVEELKEKWGVK